MKNIFNEIVKKMAVDFPEIPWVDWDKGQMNYDRPPVVFPAALVTIQVPQSENINNTLQLVNAIVTIKLCFDFTGNTSNITAEADRLKSLEYLDTVDKLYSKFQGWRTAEFNPLARINNLEEQRPDAYKVNSTSFKTAYHEATAV